MSKYKLYGRSETGSDIIEYLFHEFSIDYEFIHIDVKEVKTNNIILKNNPLGRVPMIQLPNGQHMIESMAIIYHLVEENSGLIPKPGTDGRKLFHQYMSFLSSSFYPMILLLYHPDQYVSKNNEPDLKEKSTNILNTYLNFIESKLDPYLCGDEITAADYYFFMIIGWYEELENLNCYPKISEIINIMSKNQTIINVKNKQNEREKE